MINLEEVFSVDSRMFKFVYLYKAADRKKLHQYLEKKYPNLKRTSLRCELFKYKYVRYLNECHECDSKHIEMKYRHGEEKNNSDEYYYVECLDCGYSTCIDCDSLDNSNSKPVDHNNIVAFGDYFKGFNRSTNIDEADITDEEIIKLLEGKEIYEISNTLGSLNKQKLGDYIYDKLK